MYECVFVWMSLSVIRCNNSPLDLQCVGRRDQTKTEREKEELGPMMMKYEGIKDFN